MKGDEKMTTRKSIGRVFEVIGVCILIVVAVLLNMENNDGTTVLLFLVGASLFWGGFIISRLPSEHENGSFR